MVEVIYYGVSSGGRECWTDTAAWWECTKVGCDCGGLVVRRGTIPSAEERTQMRYLRDGFPPALVVQALWTGGTEYSLFVDGHVQRTLLIFTGEGPHRCELVHATIGSELARKWIDFLEPLSDSARAEVAMWLDEPHGLAQAKTRLER